MTTVLNNIRQLEAEYRRGSLSKEEFRRTREYLLASVEDARLEEAASKKNAAEGPDMELAHICLFLLIGALACTAVGTLLLGDLTLALTLTGTLLAAVAVRAFHSIKD